MLKLRIAQLLASKGIDKPYPWLKKLGINHSTAYILLHKPTLRVPIAVLNSICEAAWCTPSDLFEWTPAKDVLDIANHPLQALKPAPIPTFTDKLKKLTPKQLKMVEEEIMRQLGN